MSTMKMLVVAALLCVIRRQRARAQERTSPLIGRAGYSQCGVNEPDQAAAISGLRLREPDVSVLIGRFRPEA